MLVNLCEETELEKSTSGDGSLFSNQYITAVEMTRKVRNWHTGKQIIDPDSEREELISIMRQSNRIWRLRNKIKNGEKKDLSYIKIHETIEDYISHGQKINAIKYYRREMDAVFDEHVSLREAKEYIDNMAINMKLRGIIN
jgi:hypothetical protein